MTTISEFKEGLYSTIKPFFATQSGKVVNGIERLFPKAEIYFDIRELEAYSPSEGEPPIPVITMLPSIAATVYASKCDEENNRIGNTDHLRIPVTCYIKMLAYSPLSLPDGSPANHKLLADYTWDLFQLVINTQVTAFNGVKIFNPKCARYPQDSTDNKETVLVSTAYFETNYASYRE